MMRNIVVESYLAPSSWPFLIESREELKRSAVICCGSVGPPASCGVALRAASVKVMLRTAVMHSSAQSNLMVPIRLRTLDNVQ